MRPARTMVAAAARGGGGARGGGTRGGGATLAPPQASVSGVGGGMGGATFLGMATAPLCRCAFDRRVDLICLARSNKSASTPAGFYQPTCQANVCGTIFAVLTKPRHGKHRWRTRRRGRVRQKSFQRSRLLFRSIFFLFAGAASFRQIDSATSHRLHLPLRWSRASKIATPMAMRTMQRSASGRMGCP